MEIKPSFYRIKDIQHLLLKVDFSTCIKELNLEKEIICVFPEIIYLKKTAIKKFKMRSMKNAYNQFISDFNIILKLESKIRVSQENLFSIKFPVKHWKLIDTFIDYLNENIMNKVIFLSKAMDELTFHNNTKDLFSGYGLIYKEVYIKVLEILSKFNYKGVVSTDNKYRGEDMTKLSNIYDFKNYTEINLYKSDNTQDKPIGSKDRNIGKEQKSIKETKEKEVKLELTYNRNFHNSVYNFWKRTDMKVYEQIINDDKQIEDAKRSFQEGEDELISYSKIRELLMHKHLCMYGDVSMSAQKKN